MRLGEDVGDNRILSKVGEGGMSVVYLAEHASTGKRVVVKELKEQHRFNQQLVDRFLREAEILQSLRHPHLARVFDVIEHAGKHCIVQEHLSGGSLSDLLQNRTPYTEEEAIRWCRDALRAMNYAHENGIVHRDLKPSNLMLDEKRQVRVIDFGIARAFGHDRLTRTSDGSIGTLEYMSPEQILTPNRIDHLTDVYSMGIVLYELLSGRVPFEGETPFSIQEKITRQSPPPLITLGPGITPLRLNSEGIAPRLARIVLRAIEKRPEARFGGCAEFALELERFLTPVPPPSRQATRSLATPALVAVAVLVIALLGWRINSTRNTPSPANDEQALLVDPSRPTGTTPAAQQTASNVPPPPAGQNPGAARGTGDPNSGSDPSTAVDTERDRRETERREAERRRAEAQRLERIKQDEADRALTQQQTKRQEDADRLARQQEFERLAKQQEAERLTKQEADRLAQLERQNADRLAKQQEAERLAKQQEADRQALLRKQQDAERLAKQQEGERLAKQQEAERAAQAQRQQAEAATQQRLQQQAADRFFATVIGTWKREKEQTTRDSRTVTTEVLDIRMGCVGALTRTVTAYEKGFSGWKKVDTQASQLKLRCDAAGRVSGDVNTQISARGATLTLGADTFIRSN